jgi:hypothetical protein
LLFNECQAPPDPPYLKNRHAVIIACTVLGAAEAPRG